MNEDRRWELFYSDKRWESFDVEFYALLKKHTGIEFNEEPKDFNWYCSMRNKIWYEIIDKEELQKGGEK